MTRPVEALSQMAFARYLLRGPEIIVWALLIAVTLGSWWLGTHHGMETWRIATIVVITGAFVKVYFVGQYFMELRHAPRLLARLFHAYCLIVYGLIVALYLIG